MLLKQYTNQQRLGAEGRVYSMAVCMYVFAHQLNISDFIVRLLNLLVQMIPLLVGA